MKTLTEIPARLFAERADTRRPTLKLVTAIIRPMRLRAVTAALQEMNCVGGITVTKVRGHGRTPLKRKSFWGIPFLQCLPKEWKIEIVVADDLVDKSIELIRQGAHCGCIGDGKIWVTEVGALIRIRTGERGLAAL